MAVSLTQRWRACGATRRSLLVAGSLFCLPVPALAQSDGTAVDLAIRGTIDPGDRLILPEPSYVAYLPAVIFAGGDVRTISTSASVACSCRSNPISSSPATA